MPNSSATETEIKTDMFGISVRLLVSGLGALIIVYAWTDLKVTTPEDRSRVAKDVGKVLSKAAEESLSVVEKMVIEYFKSKTK